MISARLSRHAAHDTAVAVRVLAALATLATLVVIPWALADAALGHASLRAAGTVAAIAVAVTLVSSLAARSLDPLR